MKGYRSQPELAPNGQSIKINNSITIVLNYNPNNKINIHDKANSTLYGIQFMTGKRDTERLRDIAAIVLGTNLQIRAWPKKLN